MRRRLIAVAILLGGCAGVLGLDEITYAPADAGVGNVDGGGDDGPRSDAPFTGDDGGVDARVDGDCSGRAGPTMVRITASMCIDSTEVTHDQYNEFLQTLPQPPATGECSWVNYQPSNFQGGSSSKPSRK